MQENDVVEALKDIFEEFEENPDNSFFSFFALPPKPPARLALFLSEQKPEYDTKNLILVLLGMMMEVFELKRDATYAAALLKNTNIKGVYLLDRVRRFFPDYRFKCVSTSERAISISFGDPLNMGNIENLIVNAGERFGEKIVSSEEVVNKRKKIGIFIGGKKAFCLSPYAITLFLSRDRAETKKFIAAFGELATRIHQDEMFDKENVVLPLRKYVFFFRCAAPTLFSKKLAENIRLIGESVAKEGLPNDVLVETRSSRLHQDRRARRFKIPNEYLGPHVAYAVFLESTREFAVRFKIPIDIPYAKALLEEKGIILGEESKQSLSKTVSIRKGAGVRIMRANLRVRSTPISFQGNEVAKMEGHHVLVLPLASLDLGTRIFSVIYENAAFISGWVATAEIECDLSEFERMVIKNMNDVVDFYNFFIKDSEDKHDPKKVISGEVEIDPRNSWERVSDLFTAHLSQGGDFYSVFHAVLHEVYEKASAYAPVFMKMERETRDDARQKLNKMIQMLQVAEVIAQKTKETQLV